MCPARHCPVQSTINSQLRKSRNKRFIIFIYQSNLGPKSTMHQLFVRSDVNHFSTFLYSFKVSTKKLQYKCQNNSEHILQVSPNFNRQAKGGGSNLTNANFVHLLYLKYYNRILRYDVYKETISWI